MVQFASYLRRVLCKTRLIFPRINGPNVCHCGAVVKELLTRADKKGSTPGEAVFCCFVPFFPLFGLFFNTFFPFGLFFILTADMLVMHLDQ